MKLSVEFELTDMQLRKITEHVATINTKPRTRKEAAAELKCSVKAIRRKIQAQFIPTVPGHSHLIPAEYFERIAKPNQ